MRGRIIPASLATHLRASILTTSANLYKSVRKFTATWHQPKARADLPKADLPKEDHPKEAVVSTAQSRQSRHLPPESRRLRR